MKKVLILTAAIGGGHNATSNAIKEFANLYRQDYEVEIVDILEYIRPVLSKIAGKSYEINAKNFPDIYGWIYELNNASDGKLTKNNLSLFNSKVREMMEEHEPQHVICVHPVAIRSVVKTREKYHLDFSITVLMTDYDYHETWLDVEVDRFIVSSPFMKYKLMADGIPDFKIKSTGIPTALSVNKKTSASDARKSLGLKDKTTVLAMGGSFGAGKLKKLMAGLSQSDENIQMVFIAGKNKRTQRQLEKYSKELEKDIRIEGFTDKVSLYMDAADFLITKPGGLTITEALIKRIPLIISKPIPGQEEENAIYLQNKGIAVRLNRENEIGIVLKDLMQDKERIQYIKKMQEKYSKPDAAKDLFLLLDGIK